MQITRYIVGLTAIAIMLLGAPSALADSDRNEGVEANPGDARTSLHADWVKNSFVAYPHGGRAVWYLEARGIVRPADMIVRKTESMMAVPQTLTR